MIVDTRVGPGSSTTTTNDGRGGGIGGPKTSTNPAGITLTVDEDANEASVGKGNAFSGFGVKVLANSGTIVVKNPSTNEETDINAAMLSAILPKGFEGSVQIVLNDEAKTTVTVQVSPDAHGEPIIKSAVVVSGEHGYSFEGIDSEDGMTVTEGPATLDDHLNPQVGLLEQPGTQTDPAARFATVDAEFQAANPPPPADAKPEEIKAWLDQAAVYHDTKVAVAEGMITEEQAPMYAQMLAANRYADACPHASGTPEYNEYMSKVPDVTKQAGEMYTKTAEKAVELETAQRTQLEEQAGADYDLAFGGPPTDLSDLEKYNVDKQLYIAGVMAEANDVALTEALGNMISAEFLVTNPVPLPENFNTDAEFNAAMAAHGAKFAAFQADRIGDFSGPDGMKAKVEAKKAEAAVEPEPEVEVEEEQDVSPQQQMALQIGQAIMKWLEGMGLDPAIVAGVVAGLTGEGLPVNASAARPEPQPAKTAASPPSAFGIPWHAYGA